jgi:uncharacterized protein YcbX
LDRSLLYPVKSMLGEEVNASEITTGGLLGDRAFALIDTSDGKIASAKNPRKWPTLFHFGAALADAPGLGARMPQPLTTGVDEDRDLSRIISRCSRGQQAGFSPIASLVVAGDDPH